MMNRLAGLIHAYKAKRVDEYINLVFGGQVGYENYILKRMWYSQSRTRGSK